MFRRFLLLFKLSLILLPSYSLQVDNKDEEHLGGIEFSILQLNLWVECTKIEKAPQYLIEQIAYLKPHLALLYIVHRM